MTDSVRGMYVMLYVYVIGGPVLCVCVWAIQASVVRIPTRLVGT